MTRRSFCLLVLLLLVSCSAPPGASPSGSAPAGEAPEMAMQPSATGEAAPASATTAPSATATTAPTATPEPAVLAPDFILYSEEPIVEHGPPGTWDGRFTDPGAVIYHDGTYHMFRNGFSQWPGKVGIAHLTSPDGREWTPMGDGPLLTEEDVPFAGYAVLASSALVEPDGTWVLYLYTWESTAPSGPSRIGRATATAPDGPWRADEEPLLLPGSEGEWDDYSVLAAEVVRTDDGYIMYYTGAQQAPTTRKIGMVTSDDGITWSKYNDPATVEAPFAESDPILATELDLDVWDGGVVHQPKVVHSPDGWIMLFRGLSATNRPEYGLATSEDGVHWDRFEGNPVFVPSDVAGAWFHDLLFQDDAYLFYVEIGTMGGTSIFLATHEGSLRP